MIVSNLIDISRISFFGLKLLISKRLEMFRMRQNPDLFRLIKDDESPGNSKPMTILSSNVDGYFNSRFSSSNWKREKKLVQKNSQPCLLNLTGR